MLTAVLAGQRGVRAFLGMGLLIALAVFSLVFIAIAFTHPQGIGCGLQTGGDYLLFHSGARMILAGKASDLYQVEGLRDIQQQLFEQPLSKCFPTNVPVAYPPVFLIPYVALSLLQPFAGFVVSTAVSVLLILLALWRISQSTNARPAVLWLFAAGFFPITLGINYGQVHALMLLAVTEVIIASREQREGRTGLWLALLSIKYQFLPLFVLFLVWQRRWRALGTFLAANLALLTASSALIGWKGLVSYVDFLWTDVAPVNNTGVQFLANWRGVTSNLGVVQSETVGVAIVAFLSIVTVAVAVAPWSRWPWHELSPEQQHLLFLGLTSAALLVGYDTQLHSAVLMLAPALFVASDIAKRSPQRSLGLHWNIDLLLLAPSLTFWAATLLLQDVWLGWTWASEIMTLGLAVTLVGIAANAAERGLPELRALREPVAPASGAV